MPDNNPNPEVSDSTHSSVGVESINTNIDTGFDQVLADMVGGNLKTETVKVEKVEKQPETPAEVAETPETTLEVPEFDPVAKVAEKVKARRDFAGMDEEETKIFKSMSNEAYSKLRPIYDAYKKAGGAFDAKKLEELQNEIEEHKKFRLHEHPEAYQLSEDYKEYTKFENAIAAAHQHWVTQLELAESGGKIRDLVKSPSGGLMPSPNELEVTPQVKAAIIQYITKTSQDLAKVQAEKERIASSYKSQFSEYEKAINNIHSSLFGKHEQVLKETAEKYLKKFPAYVRHKPENKLVAYALATVELGAADKETIQKQQAFGKASAAARRAAGPAASETSASPAGKPIGFNPEEMSKMRSEFGF
jgi:hypothetical protein